mmetsp:Transcript_11737/g.30437  ORF Transcript_11737/g.30437 Transcript_11737/m.30437 type:complete len:204 (-) Transcript_11737:41-652(-)
MRSFSSCCRERTPLPSLSAASNSLCRTNVDLDLPPSCDLLLVLLICVLGMPVACLMTSYMASPFPVVSLASLAIPAHRLPFGHDVDWDDSLGTVSAFDRLDKLVGDKDLHELSRTSSGMRGARSVSTAALPLLHRALIWRGAAKGMKCLDLGAFGPRLLESPPSLGEASEHAPLPQSCWPDVLLRLIEDPILVLVRWKPSSEE